MRASCSGRGSTRSTSAALAERPRLRRRRSGPRLARRPSNTSLATRPGWRNPKHRQQWRNTLSTYAEPVIGNLPVGAVTTEQVLEVLNPIWRTRPETATRVRGRIEQVLSYSIARGWRDGPNPAVWRGHLQLMLPAKGKVRAVEHHAALDWREAPAFMVELRARASFGARALEFLILTAVRSGEVRGATWDEFDLATRTWTIPAARMKAARPHRVPLSEPALGILRAMAKLKDGSGLVFLGQKHGTPLSDMTLTAVLRRTGRNDLTAHGFRSTFRDWAARTRTIRTMWWNSLWRTRSATRWRPPTDVAICSRSAKR